MAIISIVCPHCKTRLKASDQMIGGEAQCPECANMIVVRPEAAAGNESIYDLAASSIVDAVPETHADPDDLSHLLPVMLEREEPLRATGPRVYVNISGWEFTAGKLLAVFLLLALCVGVVAMWWLTPGETAQLVSVQPVRAHLALAGIRTQASDIDGQQPIYTIGDREQLMLAQPDPDGAHLLIEFEIPRRLLLRHVEEDDSAGVVLRDGDFVLEGGHAPARGWIVARVLDVGHAEFDLVRATTRSGWAIVPPEVKPSQELPTGPESATLAYEDEGQAVGVLRFRPRHASSSMPGLHARGNVRYRINDEISLTYEYVGGEMIVTWPAALRGLHAVESHRIGRAARLADRVVVTLLMQRPKGGGVQPLTLRLGEEVILTFDASLAGSE